MAYSSPKEGHAAVSHYCPFCYIRTESTLLFNEVGVAIADTFPVTNGHTLVLPRRHVASLYELDEAEQAALWRLVAQVRQQLSDRHRTDGFNIGLNDGQAAGQTIGHAHIHIIPRYNGDVPDPRGGVRWVVPDRAAYWEYGR